MHQAIRSTAQQYINDNPSLASAIADLANLANDEVNDGGSIEHEHELMVESIKEMVAAR